MSASKPVAGNGLPRRKLLQVAVAGAAGALCGPALAAAAGAGERPLQWRNWAGNQTCRPAQRLAPASEEELIAGLRQARGIIRAVGSGHSFSPLVPTDDTLIATDLLSGLVDYDPDTRQAEVLAGTRLHNLGPLLDAVGLAQENLPDIDYPSIAGAIATATHGTGIGFGSLSTQVTGLTLASPRGELHYCDADREPELFRAARVNLGVLGIVTRVKLQCVPSFPLTEVSRVEATDAVLEDLDARMRDNRLFEFLALPHTGAAVTVTSNPARPGDRNQGAENLDTVRQLRALFQAVPDAAGAGAGAYEQALFAAFGDAPATIRSGPSFAVMPHMRMVRFREMEYSVPVDQGPACLREVLATYRRRQLPSNFPIEYRHVRGDDLMLSMFEGGDRAAISIHQYGDLDCRPLFAELEPILRKYGGRPHWGKLHTLGASELRALYPRYWQDFATIRAAMDPDGQLLTPYLRGILGAS